VVASVAMCLFVLIHEQSGISSSQTDYLLVAAVMHSDVAQKHVDEIKVIFCVAIPTF